MSAFVVNILIWYLGTKVSFFSVPFSLVLLVLPYILYPFICCINKFNTNTYKNEKKKLHLGFQLERHNAFYIPNLYTLKST